MSWGEPGTDPGQFNIAHNICCDPDGWVYVADRENHRVQVFDGNGKYEAQWNNMHRPSGLYMETGTKTPRFFVGEIGAGHGGQYRPAELRSAGQHLYRTRANCWRGSAMPMPGSNPASSSRRTGSPSIRHGDIYVGEVSFTNWGTPGPRQGRADPARPARPAKAGQGRLSRHCPLNPRHGKRPPAGRQPGPIGV